MKKNILAILILLLLILFAVSVCNKKVEISGRYVLYLTDDKELYAYYEFNDDNHECVYSVVGRVFGIELKDEPVTYSYTLKKVAGILYEITLTNVKSTDDTITLTYNSKKDVIIDEDIKSIEKQMADAGYPSDNEVYGQFVKEK